jgi:hypothetical protein
MVTRLTVLSRHVSERRKTEKIRQGGPEEYCGAGRFLAFLS